MVETLDRWTTFPIVCQKGLVTNADALTQGMEMTGSALRLINFEPGLFGGYRRISGYEKFEATLPDGTGPLRCVAVFDGGVVAARTNAGETETNLYFSEGTGWSSPINTDTRAFDSTVTKYRFVKYEWSQPVIVLADGKNRAVKWDGSIYTVLNAAGAPSNPKYVAEFKNHLFLAGHTTSTLVFSQPNDDTGYSAALGSGEINIGDEIVALKSFRDELYIFCKNSIYKLTGDSLFNFRVEPVTRNIGCLASDSVIEIGGSIVFLGPDGFRPIAGTAKIGDVELESISRNIQTTLTTLVSNYDLSGVCSVVIREKSQFRMFISDSDEAAISARGIIGGLRNTQDGLFWEWAQTQGIKAFSVDSDFIGQDEYVIFGGYDGYAYRMERTKTFDGAAITAQFQTPYIIFGEPNVRKVLQKLITYIKAEGPATIYLSTYLDYRQLNLPQPGQIALEDFSNAAVYNVDEYDGGAIYDGTNNPALRTNLVGSCFAASFKFTSISADDNPYSIQAFTIDCGKGGRR